MEILDNQLASTDVRRHHLRQLRQQLHSSFLVLEPARAGLVLLLRGLPLEVAGVGQVGPQVADVCPAVQHSAQARQTEQTNTASCLKLGPSWKSLVINHGTYPQCPLPQCLGLRTTNRTYSSLLFPSVNATPALGAVVG